MRIERVGVYNRTRGLEYKEIREETEGVRERVEGGWGMGVVGFCYAIFSLQPAHRKFWASRPDCGGKSSD